MHSSPKGPDDPVDGVDKDIGAVVAGRYLMGTVAWGQGSWYYLNWVAVSGVNNAACSGQHDTPAEDICEAIGVVGTRYSL